MIPFASQRGGGQDLATHLQNEHDNEVVEIYDLRGSIADDLDGAFAEWKAQADTLTRCKNYLYSLSLNPDQRQGRLTRDQYLDYIGRVEEKLGLQGQPRALIFHIKNDREHLHAVYSRIDVDGEKAVHMPFDRDKLMMVTRKFARDYDIKLPEGYSKSRGQHDGNDQLLLHEKNQQDTTGITKADRMAVITDIWQRSDGPKAFIAGLEDQGYILCTGERDYVLVDYYGHTNSLPRMIDDRQVRTQQIRDFLGRDFPREGLPDVEETRENIATHREEFESDKRSRDFFGRQEQLANAQKRRRASLDNSGVADRTNLTNDMQSLESLHFHQRSKIRQAYLGRSSQIRAERESKRLQGISAFFAKVSGFESIKSKIHRRQDQRRYEVYASEKDQLNTDQRRQRHEAEYRLDAHDQEINRKLAALDKLDRREIYSLRVGEQRTQRIHGRKGLEHAPVAALDYSPWKRKANVTKAKNKLFPKLSDDHRKSAKKAQGTPPPPGIQSDFQDQHPEVSGDEDQTLSDTFDDSKQEDASIRQRPDTGRADHKSRPRRNSGRNKRGKTRK